MGWLDYYRIFEKYNGDITKASRDELLAARNANPNTPSEALYIASRKWEEKHPEHFAEGEE